MAHVARIEGKRNSIRIWLEHLTESGCFKDLVVDGTHLKKSTTKVYDGSTWSGTEYRQLNIAINKRVPQAPGNFLSNWDLLHEREGLCSVDLATN